MAGYVHGATTADSAEPMSAANDAETCEQRCDEGKLADHGRRKHDLPKRVTTMLKDAETTTKEYRTWTVFAARA